MKKRKTIAISESGYRIGEDHHNATHTDAEVELIRELHREGLSYKVLALKFETSKSTIADYCKYRRRAQTVARWKVVRVKDE